MTAFHYTAIDKNGAQQKGIIEADSLKNARQLLREKNIIPLEVSLAQQKKLRQLNFSRKQTLSHKELMLITRQLATLLAAGLPIAEVLTTVAEQTEKTSAKGLILSLRSKVLEGFSLAAALKEFKENFSELYIATVAAGEKSGHLEIVLTRLADYTEQQFNMRKKILNALIYPAIMIIVSIGIVGFLLEYVVPRMVSVYNNMGQTLPTMTQMLISLSSVIQNVGIYILILICCSYFFFRHKLKKNVFLRAKFHRTLLRLPLLGNAIKVANTARFSRTFAILSAAGVPVLDAIAIASQLITNLPIRYSVENAAKKIREGANIHLALKQTRYFPPMSIHLIASGEASGQLENMLERSANNQDNEIATLIETSLTLFEPAIILIMGAIVLFIVLAVLLPIFQLDQLTG